MWCVFQATCSASNWNQTKHTIHGHAHTRTFGFASWKCTRTRIAIRERIRRQRERKKHRECVCVCHQRILCSWNCSYNKWRCPHRTVKYTTVHAFARTHANTHKHNREREIWDTQSRRRRVSLSLSWQAKYCWQINERQKNMTDLRFSNTREKNGEKEEECVDVVLHKQPDWNGKINTQKRMKQIAHANKPNIPLELFFMETTKFTFCTEKYTDSLKTHKCIFIVIIICTGCCLFMLPQSRRWIYLFYSVECCFPFRVAKR